MDLDEVHSRIAFLIKDVLDAAYINYVYIIKYLNFYISFKYNFPCVIFNLLKGIVHPKFNIPSLLTHYFPSLYSRQIWKWVNYERIYLTTFFFF